jgi:hypothetical protein
MTNAGRPDETEGFEIWGLDRSNAEALVLELRRLAKRYGVHLRNIRLEKASERERESSA